MLTQVIVPLHKSYHNILIRRFELESGSGFPPTTNVLFSPTDDHVLSLYPEHFGVTLAAILHSSHVLPQGETIHDGALHMYDPVKPEIKVIIMNTSVLHTLEPEAELKFSVGGAYACSSTRVQQQPKAQREPEGGPAGLEGDCLEEYGVDEVGVRK